MAPIAALFAALVTFQQPQAPIPARDVVELNTGAVLVGEILHDTDAYVQIRIGGSTVVGLERSRIVAVRHGAAPASDTPAATPEAPPRDQWFVLHDADGVAVGTLEATMATTADGHLRMGEEWSFHDDPNSTRITVLEVTTADFQPVSCFYHERVQRADGAVLHERLSDARVHDDVLSVDTRVDLDRKRVDYPWRPGTSFPLAVLEQLRRDEGDAVRTCMIWDSTRNALVQRTFVAERENTDWGGEARYLRELSWHDDDSEGREWVDARDSCLRREVNGPALIAVACTPERAKGLVFDRKPHFAPSRVLAADSSFGLWLPSPAWQIDDDAPAGSVGIRSDQYEATASLMPFDHLDPDLALVSAADSVQRWFELTCPGARLRARDGARIRGLDAVVLQMEEERTEPGKVTTLRSAVYVFTVRDRTLALWIRAPRRRWADAERDFQRILQQIELRPLQRKDEQRGPVVVDSDAPR